MDPAKPLFEATTLDNFPSLLLEYGDVDLPVMRDMQVLISQYFQARNLNENGMEEDASILVADAGDDAFYEVQWQVSKEDASVQC